MSSRRVVRAGVFVVPLIALGFAFASGCSEDENPNPIADRDGSPDVPLLDGAQSDGTVQQPPPGDSGSDAAEPSDGGTEDASDDASTEEDASPSDAAAEAEASAPPPLCTTYPNDVIGGDAGIGEPDLPRWLLIALRALISLEGTNAAASCEVGQHFQDPTGGIPVQFECLGQQLAVLTGCPPPPTSYEEADDLQGAKCVSDAGQIQLGFRDPQNGGYHAADIDFVIDLIRQGAISTGMSEADADRLKALLETQRDKALTMDAGADAGPGGFSNSTCP